MFNESAVEDLSEEFNDVLDFVRGVAGMPVAAVSTGADAAPDSPTALVRPPHYRAWQGARPGKQG